MRKIEQQMVGAIRTHTAMSNGNTLVYVSEAAGARIWSVMLHGNMIASGSDASFLQVTLAGWPTVTTRSRINALLRAFAPGHAGVYQSKGAQWFSQFSFGHEIGPREWINVELKAEARYAAEPHFAASELS